MKSKRRVRTAGRCGAWILMKNGRRRFAGVRGAMMFQEREANTVKMQENLRMVFGEGCDALESKFKPVDEEIYALLSEIVQKVGHEEIGAVSFGLKDGSSGKISVKGIERKCISSVKLGS